MTGTHLEGIAGFRARLPRPFLPLSARLLLAVSVVDVAVEIFGRGILSGFGIASPAMLLGVLSNASYFLLAAAVIIGADGWPAGRPWLIAGACLFALAGFMNLGLWVWSWTQTGGASIFPPVTESVAWWLNLRALAEIGTAAAASLLLAIGLWKARPSRSDGQPRRRALLIGIALVGLASVCGYVAVGILVTALHPLMISPLEYPLLGAQVATMTAVALAAVAVLPRTGWLPEATIAVGALFVVFSKGALTWFLFPPVTVPGPWWIPIVTGLDLLQFVGLLALAGGLAMGRLVAPVAALSTA